MNATPSNLWSNLRALPRPAWILFLGTFLNKFGAFVVPFLALYLTRRGHSPAQTGLAIGAYGVGNLAASLLGGHLADKIGRRKTVVLSNLAPAHLRGRYVGASGLTWSSALIFGSAFGLRIYASNPVVFWAACGGLTVLASAIISVPVRERETGPSAMVPEQGED